MINQTEHLLETRKWGNSAGVLLPRTWIGKQVRVTLVDRTEEIKKEIFDILSPYLFDIFGIYLVGSYARNEQNQYSDIDIIAISNSTKKIISSGKYNIQIYTLEGLRNTLKNYPISIYPSLLEAKTIMNKSLLEELKQTKITKNSFFTYLKECERVLEINKKIIQIESEKSEYLHTPNIVYSAFLRLRGLFLMNSILEERKTTKIEFYTWLKKQSNLDNEAFKDAHKIYDSIKNNKSIKIRYKVSDASKILKLFEDELKRYDEPQEKTAKRN
jgi:predicted nucleotidyltransferase